MIDINKSNPRFPDQWIPQSKYEKTKVVPFRQIPPRKIRMLYPTLFPPERKEKAQRKWKGSSSSSGSSTASDTGSSSWSTVSSSLAPSPSSSVDSESSGTAESQRTLSSECLNSSDEDDDNIFDTHIMNCEDS